MTTCHKHIPSFPHSLLITFVTRVTQRVSHVGQELFTLQEHLSSPPVFSGVCVARSLVFYIHVVFCRSLFVLLSFFFWPLTLCCLSFFDLRILITPLVFSNSSCTLYIVHVHLLYFNWINNMYMNMYSHDLFFPFFKLKTVIFIFV